MPLAAVMGGAGKGRGNGAYGGGNGPSRPGQNATVRKWLSQPGVHVVDIDEMDQPSSVESLRDQMRGSFPVANNAAARGWTEKVRARAKKVDATRVKHLAERPVSP